MLPSAPLDQTRNVDFTTNRAYLDASTVLLADMVTASDKWTWGWLSAVRGGYRQRLTAPGRVRAGLAER